MKNEDVKYDVTHLRIFGGGLSFCDPATTCTLDRRAKKPADDDGIIQQHLF